MKHTDEQLLKTALYHLEKAMAHARSGLDEEVVLDACALRIVAMVDACSRLPAPSVEALFGSDWHLMRGMRNRIVHGYALVSSEVLRQTIAEELPAVRARLLEVLG